MDLNGNNIESKIQPAFGGIADHLLKINSIFPTIPYIIQNKRNDIRVQNINGFRLVIKSFKGMYWPNRLAYSIFRKSKAQRSFETSIRLKAMSFHVPTPVAYVDYYKWGILQSSYFISLHQDHEDLQTSFSKYSSSHGLPKLLGGFIFQLRQSGVNHHDFSSGNILCVAESNRIKFYMVDLNRVRFQFTGYKASLKSLSRLGIEPSDFDEMLMTYTQLCGKSFDGAIRHIKNLQETRKRIAKIKLFLKRIFFPSRMSMTTGKSKVIHSNKIDNQYH